MASGFLTLIWLFPTLSQENIHNLQIESGPLIKATHVIRSSFGFGFQMTQSLSWCGARPRPASVALETGSHLEPEHKAESTSQSPDSDTLPPEPNPPQQHHRLGGGALKSWSLWEGLHSHSKTITTDFRVSVTTGSYSIVCSSEEFTNFIFFFSLVSRPYVLHPVYKSINFD